MENQIGFEPEYLLITFASASHCIETEKRAKEAFRVHVIPTPREITASCGMALRFAESTLDEVRVFFDGLDVPSGFFALSVRGEDRKRSVVKLGER